MTRSHRELRAKALDRLLCCTLISPVSHIHEHNPNFIIATSLSALSPGMRYDYWVKNERMVRCSEDLVRT